MNDFHFWEMPDYVKEISHNLIIKKLPEKLMLSLTSVCNLKCWHCIRSISPQPGHDISKELVDFVLQKIVPTAKFLRIGGNGVGEQFLSRYFNYFLEKLDRSNLKEVH